MIDLDGSYLEGGGALVRVALALSTLTGKGFKVDKIRAGREKPGLKAQHLTAIKTLKEICDAKTSDVELGSQEMWFIPGSVKKGTYSFDIGTAGSITLLLQALILPCMFGNGKVVLNIKGGTCGKWQASIDYLQNILLPQLRKFVDKIELNILKRGYYPKGGGEISIEITPKYKLKEFDSFEQFAEEINFKIPKIELVEQGELEQVRGLVNLSSELEEKQVGERIKKATELNLAKLKVPTNIRVEYTNTLSVGGELLLWTVFSKLGDVDFINPVILGSDVLIEKGKSSEEIGKEAVDKLIKEIGSERGVDYHMADQIIPFMALLPGSKIKVDGLSEHAKTNIYVVEKFLNVGFKIRGGITSVESINRDIISVEKV